MTKLSVVIFAFCLIAGCEALTKRQCEIEDWQASGYKDGAQGRRASEAFESHNSKCLAVGTTANETVYMEGYGKGLRSYCTFTSGERLALTGGRAKPVCDDSSSSDHTRGYKAGLASLCTTEGARKFASNLARYQGTCPVASERQFVATYLTSLDKKITSTRRAETDALDELTILEVAISNVKIEKSRLDSRIRKAKKDKNEKLEARLQQRIEPVNRELSSLKSKRRLAQARLKTAGRQLDLIDDMKMRWSGAFD